MLNDCIAVYDTEFAGASCCFSSLQPSVILSNWHLALALVLVLWQVILSPLCSVWLV
jgi:hypothetical protein